MTALVLLLASIAMYVFGEFYGEVPPLAQGKHMGRILFAALVQLAAIIIFVIVLVRTIIGSAF